MREGNEKGGDAMRDAPAWADVMGLGCSCLNESSPPCSPPADSRAATFTISPELDLLLYRSFPVPAAALSPTPLVLRDHWLDRRLRQAKPLRWGLAKYERPSPSPTTIRTIPASPLLFSELLSPALCLPRPASLPAVIPAWTERQHVPRFDSREAP